jgi:hypothetical protein
MDERLISAEPDDEIPPHAEPRRAYQVQKGWHVRIGGRFLLVEEVDPIAPHGKGVSLCFAGEVLFTCARSDRLWTRTPEEQLLYVSKVELPNRAVGYRLPKRAPLITPFSGSAPGRLPGGPR